jgi:hypothetical protein
LTHVSEIVGKSGAQFVPVPDEVQNYTGFIAGIPVAARQAEFVKAFIEFLRSPASTAVMKAKGMEIE